VRDGKVWWTVRILTICPILGSQGGLAREQLSLCQALADRGHQVDVIYGAERDFSDQWHELAHSMTQIRKLNQLNRRPFGFSLGIVRGALAARKQHADVIYVYSPNYVVCGTAIGILSRTPVVLWLAFRGPPKKRPWGYQRSFQRVAKIMAISQATAKLWSSSDIPMPEVTPVLGAIDMSYYVPASPDERNATRASLGIDDDAFVVLFAGRIVPDKGVDVLVEAFGQLTDVPKIRLVLIGNIFQRDGHQVWRERLRRSADALDVLWLEGRADVLPIIQMADVAVVPSLHEAFGRSVCEPLACGVPVVASEVGGIPEILSGWLADYLVPPSDASAIATKIQSLIGWRTSDPDLGSRCRKDVVARLDLPRFVDQIESELSMVPRSEQRTVRQE